MSAIGAALPLGEPVLSGTRRRRRTREEVVERIHAAGRKLFAERGYHGATTREIARLADVSETLLYRYYGSKAELFGGVVSVPFNRLMAEFTARYAQLTPVERMDASHGFFASIYQLLEDNLPLFRALLSAGATTDGGEPVSLQGLIPYYNEATRLKLQDYRAAGTSPDFNLNAGVRLTFGMVAASVLMRDWLFPEGDLARNTLLPLLDQMVGRALGPG